MIYAINISILCVEIITKTSKKPVTNVYQIMENLREVLSVIIRVNANESKRTIQCIIRI